ncbi:MULTISPECIES: nucleotidyltransferase domain-containing protein [Microbacterium]|uniref:nucleotidyltransferase domain-containing protein n=1 Tax=Microbacterium TaxID=33882 RepID=UPI00277D8F10|nr:MULTISPECIES: nucleotidyltransferase domain-containing protein [Microbacterium]MDQ1085230.1 putative nucleotidyltransferase [Microbacterium sp. SORGH_AS_0344]MDQ1169464.1 putative nucleotidyltransferase [Microbacterium proteolyticum]
MRAVPSSLDPAVVAEIDRRLVSIEAEHRVRVPWAIESGSRAWGFPSPDSDYDCRFLFVRRAESYLSLWPERDVIETPLDKTFDVNGWDLAKTVRLIVKGNATAIEWLNSPIVYTGDGGFRDRLLALAECVVERGAIGRHYLHVTRQQRAGAATLKRFFYALRPAAALRWLETHPDAVVPPMDLPRLLDEGDVGHDVATAAHELIAVKARTRELGAGEPPVVLDRFVSTQLAAAEHFEHMPHEKDAARVRDIADDYFRREVGHL